MNDGPDVLVLLLGVVLTFVIGSLLLRAGRPYLEQVFPEPHVAKGVDRLLTVLFLLVTLGFLALMTTADFGIDGVYERVMVKLGLVLLTIGTTYGLMMFVVSQIRARRRQEQISDEISAQLAHQHAAADHQQAPGQLPPGQGSAGPGSAGAQLPGEVPLGTAPAQVPEEPPAGGYAPQQPYPQQPPAQQPYPQQPPAQQPAPQYRQPAPQQPAPQFQEPYQQQPAPQFQEPYQQQPPTVRR